MDGLEVEKKFHCVKAFTPNKYGFKGVQFAVNPITGQPDNTTESNATIFETEPIISDGLLPVFITTKDLNLRSAASPLIGHTKIILAFLIFMARLLQLSCRTIFWYWCRN